MIPCLIVLRAVSLTGLKVKFSVLQDVCCLFSLQVHRLVYSILLGLFRLGIQAVYQKQNFTAREWKVGGQDGCRKTHRAKNFVFTSQRPEVGNLGEPDKSSFRRNMPFLLLQIRFRSRNYGIATLFD